MAKAKPSLTEKTRGEARDTEPITKTNTKTMKIERLDQLTMVQFMDIACGDYMILGGDAVKAAELIDAFHLISDPAGYHALLCEKVESARRRAKILLYSYLLALLSLDAVDEVRAILVDVGKTRASRMEPDGMRLQVEQFLRSEKAALERAGQEKKDEPQDAKQLRAYFYTEVSVLMRHFKMPIDLHVTNAEVYANLRRQADEDAKAMRAAMRR